MALKFRRIGNPGSIGVVGLALLSAAQSPAFADEWMAPSNQAVFAPGQELFVRLIPGRPASTDPVTVPATQSRARAEYYAQDSGDRSYRLVADVELANPVLPAYAKLTDDGHLVTFDDWGSVGRGSVIAFYRPDGTLIRDVDITELYGPRDLAAMPMSTSMTLWRCGVQHSVGDDGPLILVFGNAGSAFELDPRRGTVTRRPSGTRCDSFASLQVFGQPN